MEASSSIEAADPSLSWSSEDDDPLIDQDILEKQREEEEEAEEEEEMLEEPEWTEEQWLLYGRALKESEGFDLPLLPDNGLLGLLRRIPDGCFAECPPKCVEAAIQHYNSNNGTNFEFVEIEKLCSRVARGCTFYMTLKVRPAGIPTSTARLQAKVLCDIGGIVDTKFTRIKPEGK